MERVHQVPVVLVPALDDSQLDLGPLVHHTDRQDAQLLLQALFGWCVVGSVGELVRWLVGALRGGSVPGLVVQKLSKPGEQ